MICLGEEAELKGQCLGVEKKGEGRKEEEEDRVERERRQREEESDHYFKYL